MEGAVPICPPQSVITSYSIHYTKLYDEEVCADLVLPYLGEGEQTVGTGMKFKHMAATPLGMKVRYNAKLTEVDGPKLTFEVEGFDEVDKIGEATHQRFIINAEKFNSRVAKKAGK